MLILIGSRALKLRVGSAMTRKCIDFDYVGTEQEANEWIAANYDRVNGKRVYSEMNGKKLIVEGTTMVEFDIVESGTSNELLVDLVKNDSETVETDFGLIPSLNILFAIKDSHKYKKFGNESDSIFWKTAMDWHLMKRMGCVIEDKHKEFHKLREQESYIAQKAP